MDEKRGRAGGKPPKHAPVHADRAGEPAEDPPLAAPRAGPEMPLPAKQVGGGRGVAGPEGFEVEKEVFLEMLGTTARGRQKEWTRLRKALTVVQRPTPGMPVAARQALRKETALTEVRSGNTTLVRMPWAVGAAFVARGRIGVHMPLPPARTVPPPSAAGEAGSWEPAEPFYDYQAGLARALLCDGPAWEAPLGAARAGRAQARAYLCMGTGLGKTRQVLALLPYLRTPALVVAPSSLGIARQWVAQARQVFPGLRVVLYTNPEDAKARKRGRPPLGPADYDLVVAVVNTLRSKPPEFFRGYGLIVYDEAHEMHSPANLRLLWKAQAVRVLGLSATPAERVDGLDRIVFAHLGRPLEAEKLLQDHEKAADVSAKRQAAGSLAEALFPGRVREVHYRGASAFGEPVLGITGCVSAVLSVDRLVGDPARLRLVAAEAARLRALDGGRHCVYIFAEHRRFLPLLQAALIAHYEALSRRLPAGPAEGRTGPTRVPAEREWSGPRARGGPNGEGPPDADADAAGPRILVPELDAPGEEEGDDARPERAPKGGSTMLRGGVPDAQLQAARHAEIVVATYAYCRRGIDLPHMTAVVLATPRRGSMTQLLGRITRRGSDPALVRQVVDVRDMHSPLRTQSEGRRAAYKKRSWPIFRIRAVPEMYSEDGAAAPEGETQLWGPGDEEHGDGGGDAAGLIQPHLVA